MIFLYLLQHLVVGGIYVAASAHLILKVCTKQEKWTSFTSDKCDRQTIFRSGPKIGHGLLVQVGAKAGPCDQIQQRSYCSVLYKANFCLPVYQLYKSITLLKLRHSTYLHFWTLQRLLNSLRPPISNQLCITNVYNALCIYIMSRSEQVRQLSADGARFFWPRLKFIHTYIKAGKVHDHETKPSNTTRNTGGGTVTAIQFTIKNVQ